MKKPIATSIEDVTLTRSQSKRAERLTMAKMTVKRAEREIQMFPAARSTALMRDMRLALSEMIEELERERP